MGTTVPYNSNNREHKKQKLARKISMLLFLKRFKTLNIKLFDVKFRFDMYNQQLQRPKNTQRCAEKLGQTTISTISIFSLTLHTSTFHIKTILRAFWHLVLTKPYITAYLKNLAGN